MAAIVEGAAQVFVESGYGAATTTRIAERAGVSVGSLYQYFPDKDALLVALTERHIAQSHARLRELLASDDVLGLPLETLIRGVVQAMLDLHLVDPVLHRLLFEEVPRKVEVTELKERGERALLSRVEELFERHPEIHVRDPRLTSRIVAQLLEALTHWFTIENPEVGVDAEAFVDEVTSLVLAYLERPAA